MGRTGATVLLIVGDDEGTVGIALELLFEALVAYRPIDFRTPAPMSSQETVQ